MATETWPASSYDFALVSEGGRDDAGRATMWSMGRCKFWYAQAQHCQHLGRFKFAVHKKEQ